MPDVEKVIKGLGEALTLLAEYVPCEGYLGYAPGACLDAIDLLKAQEPVDAIPVEWMREKMRGYASSLKSTEMDAVVRVMCMWEREQEAKT